MARPRSDIAPRLLRAARARFLQDGVDGAALREIARAAGTSLGMVTYYFPSKDDLFLAVVEEIYAGFARDIEAVMSAPGTLEERVRALYLRVGRATPEEFDTMRLILREVLVSSERRRLIMQRFLRGHVPPVLGAIIAAQQSGEIDPAHPLGAVGVSLFCLAMFPQILRRVAGEHAPIPLPGPEELGAALATILFQGISCSASQRQATSSAPR